MSLDYGEDLKEARIQQRIDAAVNAALEEAKRLMGGCQALDDSAIYDVRAILDSLRCKP